MKIKSLKNRFQTEKSLEDFKILEFSKGALQFIPDLTLSCNECSEDETDELGKDSALSFLIKFKADKLSNPRQVKVEGVSGIALPEGSQFRYEKESGEQSFFRSVKDNHHNLLLTMEQLEEVILKAFNDDKSHRVYTSYEVESYLLSKYQSKEWKTLLSSSAKTNWKKYVRQSLKKHFSRTFCDFKIDELKTAAALDSEGLRSEIKKLNDYGCFTPEEQSVIKKALGEVFN